MSVPKAAVLGPSCYPDGIPALKVWAWWLPGVVNRIAAAKEASDHWTLLVMESRELGEQNHSLGWPAPEMLPICLTEWALPLAFNICQFQGKSCHSGRWGAREAGECHSSASSSISLSFLSLMLLSLSFPWVLVRVGIWTDRGII